MMSVDQITYGSVDRMRMKGYQIIGKSAGIDQAMSSSFCKWAPSHSSLEVDQFENNVDAWGLSYFPINDQQFALARSVHGAPEYSGRGGLTVMTRALVLNRQQMRQYEGQVVNLARIAMSLGGLILGDSANEVLEPFEIPENGFHLSELASDFTDSTEPVLEYGVQRAIVQHIQLLIQRGARVMVIGRCDPLPILSNVFSGLETQRRIATSFACGLKPTNRRVFQLQFTQETLSQRQHKELQRSNLEIIQIEDVLQMF